jgi:hypothetical protein
MVVQVLRSIDLLQYPIAEHRDTLAERHGLDLVVRHVHRRRLQPVVQGGERRPHLDAKLGIEVRQRLIHEERARLTHHRAAHRDSLTLSTGQLGRLSLHERFQPQDRRGLRDPALHLVLLLVTQPQAEAEVLADGHVRVQRVVLEYHRDVAVLRREVRHLPSVDVDLAGGDVLEAGHNPKDRGLSAARGSDEHHELALPDLQRDVVHGDHVVAEDLRDAVEDDAGHQRSFLLGATARAFALAS